MKGATGFEPVTSRSAVECSTTELYPHFWKWIIILQYISNVVHNQMINHSCNMIRKIAIQRIWWMSCLLFQLLKRYSWMFIILFDIEYIDFYIYVHQPNIFAVQCLDFQSVYKFQLDLSMNITWPILSTTFEIELLKNIMLSSYQTRTYPVNLC